MCQKIGLILFLFVLISSMAFADAARDALVDLGISSGIQKTAQAEASLTDGKAYVYKVDGKAVLIKVGNPLEAQVKVGDLIQPGDKILTEKNALVAVAFDYMKKNAVQIPPETQAIFNSIEPTDIKLEDGSVFSAVDGLVQGSSWKVTTPVAVAAVRGTVYLVSYEAANGDFFAVTVDVPDDGKTSAIDIQPIDGKGEAFVPEGKEISLRAGQEPNNEMVQDLKPEVVAEIKQFFETLKSDRAESDKNGGNNNGGNGPSGPSGPSGGGNTPGNSNTGPTPPANPFMMNPTNLTNPPPGLISPGGANPPPPGSPPPGAGNPPGFIPTPTGSPEGGSGVSAPMPNSVGASGLSGFMPETMKMDTMGNFAGGMNPIDTMAGGMDGAKGPGPMIDTFGPGPTGGFGGDTFSGPPGGEFGNFAGGGGFIPTGGTNLPPLDQGTLPGSKINDPNFCTTCPPIGSCINGKLPDGSYC